MAVRTKRDNVLEKNFKPSNKLVAGKVMHFMSVECTKCGTTAEKPDLPGVNPNHYRDRFGRDGWSFSSNFRKAVCPGCVSGSRSRRDGEALHEAFANIMADAMQGETTMLRESTNIATLDSTALVSGGGGLPFVGNTEQKPAVTPPAAPVMPARTVEPLKRSQKIALAEMYFEENFILNDPEYPACPQGHGYYRNDFSDADGAEVCQLSLDEFHSLREQDYGKLWERPDNTANLAKLDQQFTLALAEIEREITAIKALLAIQPGTLPGEMQKEVDKAKKAGAEFRIKWQEKLDRCLKTFDDEMQAEIEKATEALQIRSDALLATYKEDWKPKLTALDTYKLQILDMRKDVDYVRLNAKI